MKTLRLLSVISAVFTFALVALSPLVRITDSGLGCGDDWPLCNGRIIPPLDNPEVMIEWGHRLAALGVSGLLFALAGLAWAHRARPGVGGPGGLVRPALAGVVLLVAQALLGAVTVWLELPAGVVVLHMSNALALLAVVLVTALRTYAIAAPAPVGAEAPKTHRAALIAAGLAAAALLLGAVTANLNAGPACQGFPLCNGSFMPRSGGGGLVHIHWTHRLVAYALFLHVIGMTATVHRRGEAIGVLRAVWAVLAVLTAHVVVAAVMVLQILPTWLRASHAALGTLVWTVLVYATWYTAGSGGRTDAAT